MPISANVTCRERCRPASNNQSSNGPSTQSRNQNSSNAATTRLGATYPHPDPEHRDNGVTDAVWSQLQRDKSAAAFREREYQMLKETEDKQAKTLHNLKKDETIATVELEKTRREGDDEARKRLERARIKHELERRKQEEIIEKPRKHREALEEMRRKEQQFQAKLSKMGFCEMGYRWIKQNRWLSMCWWKPPGLEFTPWDLKLSTALEVDCWVLVVVWISGFWWKIAAYQSAKETRIGMDIRLRFYMPFIIH